MKKLIALILFPFLVMPFGAKANDIFSVEIEALTLVMEQYKDETESSVELDIENIKPSYMACLLYTSPSPRDFAISRMPSSA